MSLLLYRKRKGKHIIQDQTELLEEAPADLFGQVLETILKKHQKWKKNAKKSITVKDQSKTKNLSFSVQDGT